MEEEGIQLPVIEAHCEYRQGARYDDEVEIRTTARQLSPVRIAVRLRSDASRRRRGAGHRPHRARDHRSQRAAGADARSREGPVYMKALVTGGAGFIGSHLSERLLGAGRARAAPLTAFTDFYPRPLKERNLENLRGRDGYEFVEGDLRQLDLPALLDGVTHVFHLAAQAGVRRSWGARVPGLHRPQRRCHAAPARGLRGQADRAPRVCVELVGLRRRRGNPDAWRPPCRSRCRRTA